MTKTTTKSSNLTGLEIAVIGMALRFPGADTLDEFWRNLENGTETITYFSDDELQDSGVNREEREHPDYVKANRLLQGKEFFDASFFGYIPGEAVLLSPSVRIFHECTWWALEDAGYTPQDYPGLIGLYAGASSSLQWELFSLLPQFSGLVDDYSAGQLRNRDFMPTLIAHKLNLRGPATFIQTACSTSLTAIHSACRGLLTGECQMALAGGVTVSNSFKEGYLYREGMIMSTDGHCRAFDARATGTSPGEGAGVVVLKKLKKALADHDHIYAVIKGSAINNDGVRKVGFSAPSVDGQADVIRMAQKIARVEPHSIASVEAHGTATILGDPIEVQALSQAFGSSDSKYCALGSVKTNLGHLDAAAGVAGFIKAVLSLKYGKIPPSLHFETLNPEIDFQGTPFYVNTRLANWPEWNRPRRAGVSSFGIGGTNAHVVLEEAPYRETHPESKEKEAHLILVSARNADALERWTLNLADVLASNPQLQPADVAMTLQKGRKHFNHRLAATGSTLDEMAKNLRDALLKGSYDTASTGKKQMVFMFPGQGSQYVNMGLQLVRSEPMVKEVLDECFDILSSLMEKDIEKILFTGSDSTNDDHTASLINQTEIAQPLLVAFQYTLAKLLIHWGLKPDAMVGHSIGEYTAALLAGVFSLKDALSLVVWRGRLMQQMPGGAMVSLSLPEEEAKRFAVGEVELAALNSSRHCTLSGPFQAIELLEKELSRQGIDFKRLHTSHAFHSAMMEPILEEFRSKVENIRAGEPEIPFISNLTGSWITPSEAKDPVYWTQHLRRPVRFAQGIETLMESGDSFFVEIGPGHTLSTFIRQHEKMPPKPAVFNLVRHPREPHGDKEFLLSRIGGLWKKGAVIDWDRLYNDKESLPYRTPLPLYPFEKTPFPVEVNIPEVLAGLMERFGNKPVQKDRLFSIPVPAAPIQRPLLSSKFHSPVNDTEKALTSIWSDFFGIQQIGVHDDFFELGGDSLKAMNLTAVIHQRLGVKVSVAQFFANPTIKGLAACIDATESSDLASIPRAEEKAFYPLTSPQKRLYFHYRLNTSNTDYNLTGVFHFEGKVDLKRLTGVSNGLIGRHESLRTAFHIVEGEPVQQIMPFTEDDAMVSQLTELTDESFLGFIKPFDLSRPPLIRIGVVQRNEGGDSILMDIHHIISDGISLNLLIMEFMELYHQHRLPELTVRYRDYAVWKQSLYDSHDIDSQREYWLNQFQGSLPVLNLPTDFPRPPRDERDAKGVMETLVIQHDLLAKVQHLIASENTTLFILLLTVFNTLLSKYANQEDIVVGTGSHGRNHPDLARVVGLFIQVLPMRNRPEHHKTLIGFLREVKATALSAYENEDFPFEELVKALDIQGKSQSNPVFDVALELMHSVDTGDHKTNPDEPQGNNHFRQSRKAAPPARYDMTIYAVQSQERVDLQLVFAAQLFLPVTAQRMTKHFLRLLEQLVEAPETKISDVELLSQFEKQELLEFSNQSVSPECVADYPGDRPIQQLFEDQVQRTPKASAVVFRDQELTYGELNRQSDILAGLLRQKGVVADSLVALVVEPSLHTAVGIMGIIKAGAAYLPLHHDLPKERVLKLLNDSRVSLVVTHSNVLKKQPFTYLQGIRNQEIKPIRTAPRPSIDDFDRLPFPDRSLVNYEEYNKYIGHNLIKDCISLQATRGCPYNCAYCHKIWPKKHVPRSAEHVFQEVLFNYKLGIRRFSFVDDIFNFDRKNSRRFLELIIEHKLDIHLFFLMRGDILTKEYIDLMVKAGLKRLGLALESASPRLQKLMGKNLSIKKLKQNLDYLADTYPQVILELYTMHGFPSETKEEAMETLNFMKSVKWLHFPYIFILKIFPNTEMEKLALENGVPAEAIDRSLNLAYHELPETLPWEKDFTLRYQAEFLNDYFLSKERLLHVIPLQMQTLTESEMVQKYRAYLPVKIDSFQDLLDFFHIDRDQLKVKECMPHETVYVPHLNRKFKEAFPTPPPAPDATRLLLLDLSQYFSGVHDRLDELVEPPLGLMYLLTYLKEKHKEKLHGKIAKSMIDFDNFDDLKSLIQQFNPQVIGIRTLSLYKDFFHQTIQYIRDWGYTGPIITGGPYATSSVETILQDANIDIVVLGEGEITLEHLLQHIITHDCQLPPDDILQTIPGIAFIPKHHPNQGHQARQIISLDRLLTDHQEKPSVPSVSSVVQNPHHLAYSIYTSGSTGQPRGVLVEHRNLNRLLYGLQKRIYSRYSQPQHIALAAPYSFDASVKQIFAALLLGHTLHIIPEETRVDGPALLQFFQSHRIDIADATPTLLRMLIESLSHLSPKQRQTLRLPIKHLLVGGEALTGQIIRQLGTLFPQGLPAITNVYGPTECTVDSTSFDIYSQEESLNTHIPIGTPMPFDRIDILDPAGHPVPIGLPGELFISGPKVARGYLNQPELTHQQFATLDLNHREHKEHGAPLRGDHKNPSVPSVSSVVQKTYKTGDLARWLPNGHIQFLGRTDHQVKIRGYRIELGEIESRLVSFKEIKAAVVTAISDETGSQTLCAYIQTEDTLDTIQLQRNLSFYLPDYMVPATIVQMERFPVTSSGKIDRQALPHPSETGFDLPTSPQSQPRTEVEIHLAETVKSLLGRKHIGIHENLFAIGADSIKTIQIAYGMKEKGFQLEIGDIFQYPTIARLAPKVQTLSLSHERHGISASPVTGEVLLSPVQEEFFQLYTTDIHHYNQALLFYSADAIDAEALESTIIKLHEHHDALRMTFRVGPEQEIQQWNHGLEYPHWFQQYDFRNRTHWQDALETQCNQIQASIDLAQGPLLKVALFRMDDGDRVLIALHHLVVDGLSWRILLQDIATLYQHHLNLPETQKAATSLSDRSILPPKSHSFQQWNLQLRQYADSPQLLEEKSFWNHIETQTISPIPRDFDQHITYIKDLDSLSFTLTETQTHQLLTAVAPALKSDVQRILLTAMGLAFGGVFGLERLLVALEGHGREEIMPGIDVSRTVGWFTSVYPVILEVENKSSIETCLDAVSRRLARVPRKGIGYGILKYITSPQLKQDMTFRLEPQIGFNYLGQFDSEIEGMSFDIAEESPGETHSPEGIRKYDFTVTALIAQQSLSFSIAYSRRLYSQETIRTLLQLCREVLEGVLKRGSS